MEKTKLFTMLFTCLISFPLSGKNGSNFLYISIYLHIFVFISTNLKIFHNINAFDFQEVEKPFMIYITSEK